MATRTRKRRGALWTIFVLGGALAVAGAAVAGHSLHAMLALGLALGLVLVGSPVSRTLSRRRAADRQPGCPDEAQGESAARRKRTIIVGTGEIAQSLARELERSSTHEVIGFVDCPARLDEIGGQQGEIVGIKILGTRDDLVTLVETLAADEVVIAEAPSWQQQLLERTMDPRRSQFSVHLVPSLYETAIGRLPVQRVNDIPLLEMAPWHRSRAYQTAGRIFDVGFSLVALLLTAPLTALAALAIKLTSPGPVLFRQERVGLDGTVFTMLKLRTMVLDAERDGPSLCTGYDDQRLTLVGRWLRKTRLDEIPQFANVLHGEMSVIGPRPERPCFVERFEVQIPGYPERHRIRPGITGLAQVNGHYLSSARDKLRYDLFYLYHRSFWLDVSIVLRTLTAMVH